MSLPIVPVYRNGKTVSSLCNSLSGSLRETRITAVLGYLISLNSAPFMKLFNIDSRVKEVNIEFSEDKGRSDIQIVTYDGIIIIEAKVEMTDPVQQALKYNGKWFVLITNYRTLKPLHVNVRYCSWDDIFSVCDRVSKSSDYCTKFLATDLMSYLKEHRMVTVNDSIEIYAREINEEKTLALFLHGRIYGCEFEKNNRIAEARYFSPHFGQAIANAHPGITSGISYVAKIDKIDIADTKEGVLEIIKINRGKSWLNKNLSIIQPILDNWDWDGTVRNFLFLGEPRLAFNPPVKKILLQKGTGWLSKRYLTFDELFQAWSGTALY